MTPDQNSAPPPPLGPDFAQGVLRQARRQRRRTATVRLAAGMGASLALVVLLVRPGHPGPKRPIASGAVASAATAEAVDAESSDPLEADDGDPGSYFFPDSQGDAPTGGDLQSPGDDDAADGFVSSEGSEE